MGDTDFVNQSTSERGMNVIAARTFNQSSCLITNHIGMRHWAFVRSLKGSKQVAMWFTPVARIFRRAVETRVQQVSLAVHMALRMKNSLMVANRDVVGSSVHTEMRLHRTEAVVRMLQLQRLLESRVNEQREVPWPETSLSTQMLTRNRVEGYMVTPRLAMTLAKPQRTDSADSSENVIVRPIAIKADGERDKGGDSDATRSTVRTSMSLPERELSRVTDHVIRQLDRRVLSYCERTGRV